MNGKPAQSEETPADEAADEVSVEQSAQETPAGETPVIVPQGERAGLVPPARRLVWFTVGYLALTWSAVYAVDVLDVGGLQDALARWDEEWPLLFYHLFLENGPTEWLQWLFLGGLAVTSGAIAGMCSARGDRRALAFWRLLALAGVLMIMEDAGNVRHRLGDMAMLTWTDHGDWPRVYAELVFFGAVAAVPAYALLRYHDVPRRLASTWRLLLVGVGVYGLAAASSGTRTVNNWYHHVGTWVHEVALGGRLRTIEPGAWDLGYEDPTGFILMDTLVEESVELLGATLVLASAVAYLRAVQRALRPLENEAAAGTQERPPADAAADGGGGAPEG